MTSSLSAKRWINIYPLSFILRQTMLVNSIFDRISRQEGTFWKCQSGNGEVVSFLLPCQMGESDWLIILESAMTSFGMSALDSLAFLNFFERPDATWQQFLKSERYWIWSTSVFFVSDRIFVSNQCEELIFFWKTEFHWNILIEI